jgi:membrane-associated PAP2 superfamily phosphatase
VLWSNPERWWSLEALVHRLGDPIVALDALNGLADDGLIHRQGKFVFPTRAALHYHHLFG